MSDQVIKIHHGRCKNSIFHHGPFLVDEALGQVECGACGKMLNPINVLLELSGKESRYAMRVNNLILEIGNCERAIQFKNKVKCEHCSKFTKVKK